MEDFDKKAERAFQAVIKRKDKNDFVDLNPDPEVLQLVKEGFISTDGTGFGSLQRFHVEPLSYIAKDKGGRYEYLRSIANKKKWYEYWFIDKLAFPAGSFLIGKYWDQIIKLATEVWNRCIQK